MKKFFLLCLILFFMPHVIDSGERKILIIGTGNYPPFEYRDKNGALIGYDIELGNEIARKLNMEVRWQVFQFKELFTALESKKIRMVIGAIHITPDRKVKYNTSIPYINTGLVFVVRKANTIKDNIEDFSGKTIAVKNGSTGQHFVVSNKAKYDFKIVSFEETDGCIKELENGKVDAVVSDYLSSKNYVRKNNNLMIATTPFNVTGIGVLCHKSDVILKDNIDNIIQKLKEDGTLKKLYQKWLL